MQQTPAPATDAVIPTVGAEEPAESAARRLLGQGSIYTVGAALNLFASALAIPAATRLLGTAEFGTVTLAVACLMLLIPVANLALPFAIIRTHFDQEIGDHA